MSKVLVFLLPLMPKGGFHGTPLRKTLSHRNFAMKFAPYMYALLETIIPEKKFKCCTVSEWRPNSPIFISRRFDFGQNLKNHFPKGIFNEMWLKVGNILKKKIFRFKMAAKTIFGYCAIMLIYAN